MMNNYVIKSDQGSQMRNRLKTLIFVIGISLLTLYIIGQIIVKRDPISNNFPLRPVWKTQLRGNAYGISIADDEMVLVRTSTSIDALDANSGSVIWHRAVSWQADAKPVLAENGKIYITDGNSVLALEQTTGSVLWKQNTAYSSLWITDVSESVVIGNQLGIDITGLDANTGEFLWRKPVCRGYGEAFSDGKNIYIPCDGLKAIDIKSGDISWTADVGILGDIDHAQDVVYYFSDTIDAYDLRNQKILWRTSVTNTGFENIKITSNALFYADDVRLCMLDIHDGHLEWCAKTTYPQAPVVVDNNVYSLDGNHKTIRAFRTTDGEQIGTLNFSNFNYFIVDRQLLASNEDLLFIASGKNVYAYTK